MPAMMILKLPAILVISLTTLIGLQTNSCNRSNDDQWTEWGNPSRPTALVVFFKKGTSNDEINRFWQDDLKTEKYNLGFVFRVLNNGYEGVGINFSTNAKPEQREALKIAISESPIVYKVYENVIPTEIKDLSESQGLPNTAN